MIRRLGVPALNQMIFPSITTRVPVESSSISHLLQFCSITLLPRMILLH